MKSKRFILPPKDSELFIIKINKVFDKTKTKSEKNINEKQSKNRARNKPKKFIK